jgi:hypothetical protein
MEISPKARNKGLVVQEMPNEVLVYDLDSNKAHCLNKSAALVWRSCDGTRSVADIVKEFEVSGSGKVSEDFVWLALDQLQENELLETTIGPRFSGTSRRQAIKTIGMASIVAVPVIASLVAPPNALASVSCTCLGPIDCVPPCNTSSCQIVNNNGTCI